MSSYGDQLSLKHSRECRDRCRSVPYTRTFPDAKPNPRLQAKNTWGFMQGGTFSATTVGGGMTGLGADLLIIDDPHKNRQEAESKLVKGQDMGLVYINCIYKTIKRWGRYTYNDQMAY